MKYLLAIILTLPACTSPGTLTVGDVTIRTAGRVGGKGILYVKHKETEILAADNNEDSFRELNKSARFGIGAAAAVGIARDLSTSWTSTTNAKTAADVSKSAGAEATKQAGIAAEVSKAQIAAEAEAAAAAASIP